MIVLRIAQLLLLNNTNFRMLEVNSGNWIKILALELLDILLFCVLMANIFYQKLYLPTTNDQQPTTF